MKTAEAIARFKSEVGYRPVVCFTGGLLLGRYICKLPIKITLPLTLAAAICHRALEKSGAPPFHWVARYLIVGAGITTLMTKTISKVSKRFADLFGFWLCMMAFPAIASKLERLELPKMPSLSQLKELLVSPSSLTLEAARKFVGTEGHKKAKYWFGGLISNNTCFPSFIEQKKKFIEKEINEIKLNCLFEKSAYELTVKENLDLEIWCSPGGQDNRVSEELEMTREQKEAFVQAIFPTPEYVSASFKEMADELTKERAKKYPVPNKIEGIIRQRLFMTNDGRLWNIVQNDKGQYLVAQINAQMTAICGEAFCTWPGYHPENPVLFIGKDLFEYIDSAFGG